MTIRPLGHRLLVLVDKDEGRVTSGGIHLSRDAYFDREIRGVVKGVGSEVHSFRVGDRVLFSYRHGIELDEDFMVVRDSDVLGVEDGSA